MFLLEEVVAGRGGNKWRRREGGRGLEEGGREGGAKKKPTGLGDSGFSS